MKNKLFFTFLIFTLYLDNPAFCFGGDKPSPPGEDNDPGMAAICTFADGSAQSLQGKTNDRLTNNRKYKTWKIRKNANGTFIGNGDASYSDSVWECYNRGGELDEDALATFDPNGVGVGDIREANLTSVKNAKTYAKLDILPFVYTQDQNNNPTRLFDKEKQKYGIMDMDASGKVSNAGLQALSNIQSTSPLHKAAILEKVQKIVQSGRKTIDVGLLTKQLDGISSLDEQYKRNISNAKIWLAELKKLSYDDLNNSIQSIESYLNSVNIGDANISDQKFKDILAIYNKILPILNSAKIPKDRMRTAFDAMMETAKQIPGDDPANTEDMVNAPKKYTIVHRLISDAVGDPSTAKIFYNLDGWLEKMHGFEAKMAGLQSTKATFIPDLNANISKLTTKVSGIAQTRESFESKLNASAKKGSDDADGTVHTAYSKLQKAIEAVENEASRLQSSIDGKKTITDPNFQTALASEKKRLDELMPTITTYHQYAEGMSDLVKKAYQKAEDKKNGPLNKAIQEANKNITSLKNLLDPIITKINAGQDTTVDWNASKSDAAYLVKELGLNSTALSALLEKATDDNTKTLITQQKNAIQTAIDNKKTVEAQAGSALGKTNKDVKDAQEMVRQLTWINAPYGDRVAPQSLEAAVLQYDKDKIPAPLIQKYTEMFTAVTRIRAALTADLTILNTMDQNNADVKAIKALVTQLSGGKATSGSMCALLHYYYGLLVSRSRAFAPQVQPVP